MEQPQNELQKKPRDHKAIFLGLALIALLAAAAAATVYWRSQSQKSSVQTYYFKDLGVQINLPDQLKGLSTSTQTSTPSGQAPVSLVQLHLASYTSLANQCLKSAANTPESFANLLKIKGSPPGSGPAILKKFSSFYIINLGGNLPSIAPCKDINVEHQLNQLSSSLNQALTNAFKTATTPTSTAGK